MDDSGRPPFSKDVYERWLKTGSGTDEQRKRYKAAVAWYNAHPEQAVVSDLSAKPKSKLGLILLELLEQAQNNSGTVARRQLAGGLRVDVKVVKGITHLQLSREGVYPSETEWQTTLRNWPILIYVDPERAEYQGRHYLTTSWKVTECK